MQTLQTVGDASRLGDVTAAQGLHRGLFGPQHREGARDRLDGLLELPQAPADFALAKQVQPAPQQIEALEHIRPAHRV